MLGAEEVVLRGSTTSAELAMSLDDLRMTRLLDAIPSLCRSGLAVLI